MYGYKEKNEKGRGQREYYKWKNNYGGQNKMENNPKIKKQKLKWKSQSPRKSCIKEWPR